MLAGALLAGPGYLVHGVGPLRLWPWVMSPGGSCEEPLTDFPLARAAAMEQGQWPPSALAIESCSSLGQLS